MGHRNSYYPARARSARARRACALRALGLLLADGTPTGGRGEDFLSRQPDFFTETAVTSERKVEKSFPRWEINRHIEGKKRHSLFAPNHVLATTGKICSKKKRAFAQITK